MIYDGTIEKPSLDDIIIEHYGVKGMKWGVRRYEKYPGSYTKRGVKKTKEAISDYEKAISNYKKTKEGYKQGKNTKADVRASRRNKEDARYEANRHFKDLKFDKRADQGKELYKRGKTIGGNSVKYLAASLIGYVGSWYLGNLISDKLSGTKYDKPVTILKTQKRVLQAPLSQLLPSAIRKTYVIADAAWFMNKEIQNSKLRAYYGHGEYSSNKRGGKKK